MQEERYGTRDRTYSAWHRRLSTRRFVGIERAQSLAMIDLDMAVYVEYDDATKEPLALVETAYDHGQVFKSAAVTCNLAKKAGIPAFIVLYKPSERSNPADPRCKDISAFRVRRVWPEPTPYFKMTPERWAQSLVRLRDKECAKLDDVFNGSNCFEANGELEQEQTSFFGMKLT